MQRFFAALATSLLLTPTTHALETPSGRVLLTVTGDIATTNVGEEAQFDREMLMTLTQHETVTSTPWHDGVMRFSGPLVSALLEAVGGKGDELRVTALNDYSASVPVSDVMDYPVILAMTMNGEPLSIRDHGPLFIIYPFDEHPELLNEEIIVRSVWQINRIEVR